MEIAETRRIKAMDSNKGQSETQESRVYQAEKRVSGTRDLFRFKGITRNIVQNVLMTLDEISGEEMQRATPSSSRIEKYYLLHHYLDYLKGFSEGEI